MKRFFTFIGIVCIAIATMADEKWVETCGNEVSKNEEGHWPYTTDYNGFDHRSSCSYDGWNSTVRYLDRYADNGPHVYLAANKDAFFAINNIAGGTNCQISFDAVCYLKDGASSYKAADILTVEVNGTAYSLGTQTMLTDAFSTFKLPATVSGDVLTLRFTKSASVAQEIRIDNITIFIPTPEPPEEDPDDPSGDETDCMFPELEGKKGMEILTALNELIKEHKVLTYDDIRADKTGVDFRSNGTVWDIYSGCSFGKRDYCPSGSDFNECDCYNREHILPKSYWKHDSKNPEPMYTDLHHVYPTDFVANTQRSNNPYGEVTGNVEWSNEQGSKTGYSGDLSTTVFEPADEYKGDIARIYFYMLTCYKGKNFAQGYGYKTFSWQNNLSTFTYAMNNIMMKWHRNDPVSQKEKNRNNAVELLQGNRNPFVDAPELAEYIWGKKKDKKYTCGTPIEAVEAETPAVHAAEKIVRDGHIYILRDGKVYSVTGMLISIED